MFQAWNGNLNSATITAGGSASFAGQVEVGNYNSGDSTSGGIVVKPTGQLVVQGYVGSKESPITAVQGYETASNGSISGSWEIKSDGNATFKSTRSAGVVIETEPDNDANYVSTTDSEGVETRVYNGPTLDVKAVIQELQQRVNDRDAVIADLTTRIQTLEGGNN